MYLPSFYPPLLLSPPSLLQPIFCLVYNPLIIPSPHFLLLLVLSTPSHTISPPLPFYRPYSACAPPHTPPLIPSPPPHTPPLIPSPPPLPFYRPYSACALQETILPEKQCLIPSSQVSQTTHTLTDCMTLINTPCQRILSINTPCQYTTLSTYPHTSCKKSSV